MKIKLKNDKISKSEYKKWLNDTESTLERFKYVSSRRTKRIKPVTEMAPVKTQPMYEN